MPMWSNGRPAERGGEEREGVRRDLKMNFKVLELSITPTNRACQKN